MVLQRSTLNNKSVFTITCLKCNWTLKVDPSFVENHGRIVKTYGMKEFYIFTCRCGERFNIQLDFRQKSRHPIEASSFYTTLTRDNFEDRLKSDDVSDYQSHINSTIRDISVDGIGLISNGSHTLKPDDELIVKFTLRRSGKERPVQKRVIVRSVSGKYIGAEFFPKDKNDPDIGFYFMEEENKGDDDDLFFKDSNDHYY